MNSHVFPNQQDSQSALHSYQILSSMLEKKHFLKVGEGDESFILPEITTRLLMEALSQVSTGKGVGLFTLKEEMTTQEAADFLNVSRPYFVSLLEAGEIPYKKVGTKRRVRFEDIKAFKEKSFELRSKTLEKLMEQAQILNLGYE